jgi:hypothetical protein
MKDNKYYDVLLKKILNETLEDKANEVMEKLKFNKPGSSFDYVEEGETCECGSTMVEGQCMECGYMKDGEVLEISSDKLEIGKKYKYNPKKFDRLDGKKELTYKGKTNYDSGSQHHHFQDDKFGALMSDDDLIDFEDIDIEEITERLLSKGQKFIAKQAKPHNKIDAKDFEMLRKKKETKENKGECMECGDKWSMEEEETHEGNAFTEKLRRTPKGGKFKMGNKEYTDNSSLEEEVLYKLHSGNDSELFTESEIVDMIEQIIMEEKDNIKKGKTPAGLAAYEKAHKGSGKENKDYMKEFTKKITEYEKDGSKEKFTTDPKHFPKGNGELEKMSKKAYVMSDGGKEFLDDYMSPGMEDLVPEEITYDEDWVSDNIKGSSRTGNNPKWANAEETEVGEKLVKKQKAKKFHKAKETAYRKSKQPISDGTGENSGGGIDIKLESINNKKTEKLNEEFNRMKSLIGYNQKTQ